MFSADEVSPRLEQWADRARGSARAVLPRMALGAAYLMVMARLGTTSASHWLLAAVFAALPIVRGRARDLLRDAVPFILFAAIYDALGLVKVHVAASGVHTFWPYWLDRALFGVPSLRGPLSLNEVFARHHWPSVDLLTGLVYLAYIYVVVVCAIFLGAIDRTPKGRTRVRALGWTFL